MKDIERCSCGQDMICQRGDIRIFFGANKRQPHRLDDGGLYVGHYQCSRCDKLWVTTTLKRFRPSHVITV